MADAEIHDWEIIARSDPWFGVVSAPEFRAGAIDEAALNRFYATGEQDIAALMDWFDQDLGVRPAGARALDVGCGVGRLAFAMARRAAEVWGYDISPSMLALARTRAPPNLVLSTDLPEGPFDWINSFIVFQHIPPAEGLALLDACLARCAPQAFLSLQFTFWRDGRQPNPHPLAQFRRSVQRRRAREAGAADDLIRMYDYDLGDIAKRLTAAGFPRLVLRHTCHARHHGAWILARRTL